MIINRKSFKKGVLGGGGFHKQLDVAGGENLDINTIRHLWPMLTLCAPACGYRHVTMAKVIRASGELEPLKARKVYPILCPLNSCMLLALVHRLSTQLQTEARKQDLYCTRTCY